MIKYPISSSNQYLTIAPQVVRKLLKYIQNKNQPEKGGLLFAEFKLPEIYIADISLPYRNDIQRIFSFIPDQKHQQYEIMKKYNKGLHFVGEWHTHPQQNPEPSSLDIKSMQDCFLKSDHELNYFIMLILGNTKDFNKTWISIHNEETYKKLNITHEVGKS